MEQSRSVYATQLLSNISLVASQSASSRKIIEDILEAFEERASIEEKYSKSLDKLVQSLAKLEEKNTHTMFKLPIYCLKNTYATRQRQAEEFVHSLKQDLVIHVKQLLAQHNASAKRLVEDARRIEKENNELLSIAKRAFADYRQKKREYEQTATVMVVYNLLSEYTEKKRIQQYYKVNQVSKEANEQELRYKQAIQDYNNTVEPNKNKLINIMDQLQNHEEKRVQAFKDALLKQIMFEVSYVKNIQYDLDKINEKLNEIMPFEEIQKFANAQTQINDNPLTFEKLEMFSYSTYISNSLQRFFQKEFDEMLTLQHEQQVQETMKLIFENQQINDDGNEKVSKAVYAAQIVHYSWQDQPIDPDLLTQLKARALEDFQIRRLLIIALQIKRQSQQFKLEEPAYQNLVGLFKTILDICFESNDAITAKSIMTLSFTFHKVIQSNEKPKVHYVQNEFVNHKIWETRDFWETCIIQQIYESIKEQQPKWKQMSQMEQIQNEKTIILTILTQLSQNMLLFQFKIDALKDIMQKFSQFFELNEEISNDLYNAIEGFERARLQQIQQEQLQQQQQQQQQEGEGQQPPQNEQATNKVMGKISQFFQQLNKE